MSETPRYVLEAVRALLDDKNPEHLVGMLRNGIPLHAYPESRELLEKLLREEPIRPAGGKDAARLDAATQNKHISIQIEVAQLLGADFQLISNNSKTPTACSIVAKRYIRQYKTKPAKPMSANGVKGIWEKVENEPWVESHKQSGRDNEEQIRASLRLTGEI